MKKIFFVGHLRSSFVRNDYEGLKKYFKLRLYAPNLFDIVKNMIWCDTVLGWFASYRMVIPTILAKILNKKIVVIAGGYDVVYAPEIDYGAFIRPKEKRISKFVFKHADIVLPVSDYIKNELLEKVTPKQVELIYNGVDINKFYPYGDKCDKLVITVGEINWSNLKRKGIAHFVKAAKYVPEAQFVVIGQFKDDAIDYLRKIATPNVSFTGFVTDEELLTWYQVAKVYAQLSYHEGFGLSVAEAMLCECIPVVSNRGALKEVAGKSDSLYGDPKFAAACIKSALRENSDRGKFARWRIAFNFSLLDRIERLRMVLR